MSDMSLLGEVRGDPDRSHIVSQSELMAREGYDPSKGMNIRYDGRSSLFLMSIAAHAQQWESDAGIMIYDGHDATGAGKNRKKVDQPMYKEEGVLSDNGKFYKEANAFKDGKREAMEIQVYEWLDAGVWFDKGLFTLEDARYISEDGRKVFKFHLRPIGGLTDRYARERMIPLSEKRTAWQASAGACIICGSDLALRFVRYEGETRLVCTVHARAMGQ